MFPLAAPLRMGASSQSPTRFAHTNVSPGPYGANARGTSPRILSGRQPQPQPLGGFLACMVPGPSGQPGAATVPSPYPLSPGSPYHSYNLAAQPQRRSPSCGDLVAPTSAAEGVWSQAVTYAGSRSPLRISPRQSRGPSQTATVARPCQATLLAPGQASSTQASSTNARGQETPRTARVAEGLEETGPGQVVTIDGQSFRIIDILGRGSYSVVWRAESLDRAFGQEVALKEVRCTSQAALLQAVFEVQVLLELERSATATQETAVKPLNVPRCLSYKVDHVQGQACWTVHTAMTIVPGDSLDVFYRRAYTEARPVSSTALLTRGCVLARKMLRDICPALQLLEPIAWHRDVNAHNILIGGAPTEAPPETLAESAAFTLIDFGLAVDSKSWSVEEDGQWRTAHIGGDSRYWPPSSWIMHLYGPEGFEGRERFREQYLRRLDIHGLGIAAVELLCSVVQCGEEACLKDDRGEEWECWERLFAAWTQYWENVWRWWSMVYTVFLQGGDISPVQAQLMHEGMAEHLDLLLQALRKNLRDCAALCAERPTVDSAGSVGSADLLGPSTGVLLGLVADMIDECSDLKLDEIGATLAATEASGKGQPRREAAPLPEPPRHRFNNWKYELNANSAKLASADSSEASIPSATATAPPSAPTVAAAPAAVAAPAPAPARALAAAPVANTVATPPATPAAASLVAQVAAPAAAPLAAPLDAPAAAASLAHVSQPASPAEQQQWDTRPAPAPATAPVIAPIQRSQQVAPKPRPRISLSKPADGAQATPMPMSVLVQPAPVPPRSPELWRDMEGLDSRIRAQIFAGDDGKDLEERMRKLEVSLLQLELQSRARAKLGMERLTERYVPKVLELSYNDFFAGSLPTSA